MRGICCMERTHWTENCKSSISPAKDGVEDVLHPGGKGTPLGFAVEAMQLSDYWEDPGGGCCSPTRSWLAPSPGRELVFILRHHSQRSLARLACPAQADAFAAAFPRGPGSEQGPWVRDRAVAVTAVPVLVGARARSSPGPSCPQWSLPHPRGFAVGTPSSAAPVALQQAS